jgi:hypothetical protein
MKSVNRANRIIYWLIVSLVAAVSFIHLSPISTNDFHSDIGVHVLMTYAFKWPGSLYFWGQDRLGSVVPMFGHFLYRCLNFSPIVSASISEYFFLIVGFFFLSSFFRTNMTKIIFAIAWFLPSYTFRELVQLSQPYAVQFCFLGMMAFFINKSIVSGKTEIKKALFFFFIGLLSLFISIWVSDLSWIAWLLLIFMGVLLYPDINNNGKGVFEIKIPKPSRSGFLFAGQFIIITYCGISFLNYAKEAAEKIDSYSVFGNITEITEMIGSKTELIYKTIVFRCWNILLSWHTNLFLFGVLILSYFLLVKKQEAKISVTWRNFFLFFGLLSLPVLFSSHWVFLNAAANRYFIVIYISLWMAVLITIERYTGKKLLILQIIFLTSTLFSATSLLIPLYYPEKQHPETEQLSEFKKLGRVGVIGNYWHSYNIAAIDPENIKATPNDMQLIRCNDCVDSVFSCSTIYLVQDGWLDSLPKEIDQFGFKLERKGMPREIGKFTIAPYSVKPFNKRYSAMEMKTFFGKTVSDTGSFSKNVYFTDSIFIKQPSYLIYGPYIKLSKGTYVVRYALKASHSNAAKGKIATIDVSFNHGDSVIVSKDLTESEFIVPDNYNLFELRFKTKKIIRDVEFRVHYWGKESLWFDHAEINQKEK